MTSQELEGTELCSGATLLLEVFTPRQCKLGQELMHTMNAACRSTEGNEARVDRETQPRSKNTAEEFRLWLDCVIWVCVHIKRVWCFAGTST